MNTLWRLGNWAMNSQLGNEFAINFYRKEGMVLVLGVVFHRYRSHLWRLDKEMARGSLGVC
jgi:hypothetical protein